jgi:23S rRNA (uracil1939-C5)-methyltransferase
VESGVGAVEDLEFNASRARLKVNAVQSSVDLYLEKVTTRPDFVLADPPRSGLGKAVAKELLRIRAPRLHLVSCDPSTLARDVAALCAGGYLLKRLTLVDLFPQTFHIETIAELTL